MPSAARRVCLAVVLVALLAGQACSSPGARHREARPDQVPQPPVVADGLPMLGVHIHATWDMYYRAPGSAQPTAMLNRQLDTLATHHVRLVRVDVGWSTSQPTPAPPNPHSWYNRRIAVALRAAEARHLRVLLVLQRSPAWSRPGTGGDAGRFPTDPTAITPWTRWLSRTFGRQVVGFEVWNEPNLNEFTGVASASQRPARYVALLRAAAAGLRSGRPGTTVVFGGPSRMDVGFVRACYELGARALFDVMAVHPYQSDVRVPPGVSDADDTGRMANFPLLANVMARYGDAAKPVWWTEFGYGVVPVGGAGDAAPRRLLPTADAAAHQLTGAFELARTRYPQVRLAVVYTAYRPSAGLGGYGAGLSLLSADGAPSVQLDALAAEVARHPGVRALRGG